MPFEYYFSNCLFFLIIGKSIQAGSILLPGKFETGEREKYGNQFKLGIHYLLNSDEFDPIQSNFHTFLAPRSQICPIIKSIQLKSISL